ncbi:hypothetical protein BV25DRAFT_1824714 [Artomyces pyxidatus]|uniref:Uncharacterized protein n=1 Tax=Artomyces pyxidatus TaxID=48021 RepID=A0ACB8T3T3_9AGAM|nr:hypothetical protein BV25DRAFT_1824714 [Artomyces pyxidatus]
MPSLPEDVLIEILEWVYRASQTKKIDYPTLCAASLVCRSWQPLTQRLLFRRVQQRHGDVHLLIDIFQQNRSLGQHVRALTVQSDNALDTTTLLEFCPYIIELKLKGPWSRSLSYRLDHVTSRLRALDLHIAVLDVGHNLDVSALLQLWPSVQFLLLSSGYRRAWSHHPSTSLRGLKITATLFYSRVIDTIIPSNLDTLREIEVDDDIPFQPLTPPITRLLTRVGPRLTSLSGPYPPHVGLHEHLGSLEQVIFCALPNTPYTFPKHVRHVGYHRHETGEPFEISELPKFLVALEILPHLQLVTVTRALQEDVLATLETMCRPRGVEFFVYPDAESFRRSRNVDWI